MGQGVRLGATPLSVSKLSVVEPSEKQQIALDEYLRFAARFLP